MTKLTTLDISEATLVNRYLAEYPPLISEHTFTNLYAWKETKPIYLSEIEETLVFMIKSDISRGDKLVIMGPPAGRLSLAEIFRKLGEEVIGAVRIPGEESRAIASASFTVTPDRDNSDYVYLVRDMTDLAGRQYAKKRSHIKQCLATFDCKFEAITGLNISECHDLQVRWCRSRKCELDPGLCGESKALQRTLDHFIDFKLLGGAIRVNGQIEALSIGERLNRTTAVCHFEKAMPQFTGLSQLINQWFTRECLPGFKFVNREQDLGISGLRQAKESYHPDHLVEKFKIFRN